MRFKNNEHVAEVAGRYMIIQEQKVMPSRKERPRRRKPKTFQEKECFNKDLP